MERRRGGTRGKESSAASDVYRGQGETDPETDDGVILDEESEDDGGREPGEWPEEPADDGPKWEPPTIDETEGVGESPDVEPTSTAVTVPEGSFLCTECGFTTSVESSSLREGDFCPDCHTGTLSHRLDAE